MWAQVAEGSDFTSAQSAYAKGNTAELSRYAVSMKNDLLGVYPQFWLLESQLAAQPDAAIEAFLAQNQGTWLAERLRADWLRVLGSRRAWPTFRAQYEQLQDAPGEELVCYNYQARIDAGDKTALPEARATLWFTPRELPGSCSPLLQALVTTNTVVESDMWARLRLALEANRADVVHYLSGLLNETITPAQLEHIAANPGRYLEHPPLATRMQRELAIYALFRLTRTDLDSATSHLLAIENDLGPVQNYAWRMLGESAARNNDSRALAWFRNSGDLPYTDGQQEWRIRAALRAQDWDTVQAAIEALPPQVRSQRGWQYWRARALEAHHRLPEASHVFAELAQQGDYYGLLARDRQQGAVMTAMPVSQYKVTADDLALVKEHADLQRALALYELDDRQDAVKEWNWALRNASDRLLLAAAEQANAVGWFDRAIFAAERARVLHNDELTYLAPYRDITHNYAAQQNVDESWVYGLIRQESRFAMAARSSVGAHGLMQIMPDTARWVARKLHLPYKPAMLEDINGNVQLGTYYLKHVLETFGNSQVLATAAYNAGPGRAREWQGSVPLEAAIYVESIPFQETRDYVRKVMTNAVFYSRNFRHEQQTLTARMGTIPARGAAVDTLSP